MAKITTGQIEDLTNLAKESGAKGLAFIKVEGGEWKSPIVKFLTEPEKEALNEEMDVEEGDLLLFGADRWETVCTVLGRIRLKIAEIQRLIQDPNELKFLWVFDFPLLGFDSAENKWSAMHHPFTRPKTEDLALLEAGEYEKVRAEAYDVVLNGVEIGGGSIRIHEQDLQAKMFEVLGITTEQQKKLFGHLLKAFTFGAPPHGGIALGSRPIGDVDHRNFQYQRGDRIPEEQSRIRFDDGSPQRSSGKATPGTSHPESKKGVAVPCPKTAPQISPGSQPSKPQAALKDW